MNNYKIIKNIADVPNNWGCALLKNLTTKIGDGLHGTPKYVVKSEYAFINGNNLVNGKIKIEESTKFISEIEYKKYQTFLSNKTVLLSINGTIGNIAIYNGEKVILGKSAAYINVTEDLEVKFLYYFFKTQKFKRYIELSSQGSTIKNFSLNSLRNTEILYPPLPQQQAISSILSTQEKIISDTETLISKLEQRFSYFSEELLSGRLRVKEVDGKTVVYKNEEWQTIEVNGELKVLPEDWEVKKIKDLILDNPKSKLMAKDISKQGKYPAFNCSKNQNYYSDKKIISGENIFLSTGGAASVHFSNLESAYTTDVYSLKSNSADLSTKYIYYMLSGNIQILENMFYGAGLKHLNKKQFKDTEWFYPEKSEQKSIVQILANIVQNIQNTKDILKREKQKFDWLMDNLLSGKYIVESTQRNHMFAITNVKQEMGVITEVKGIYLEDNITFTTLNDVSHIILTKKEVIDLIDKKTLVKTAILTEWGNQKSYTVGAEVVVYEEDNKKNIRTESNKDSNDNLDNLPTL